MVELILCEKPSQANKIAHFLANDGFAKLSMNKVPYFKIKRDGKEILVASGVGHLFTVSPKEKKAWTYPVYDIQWEETPKANKSAKFAAPYLKLLKSLKKEVDEFTVATDYDVEGEVIGFNILRFIFNTTKAKRMKFSTLTKNEIINSYNNKLDSIVFGQAYAGVTRHVLDWYYGINISRALTLAIKNATQSFKLLSAGRVQGPSLKIIVDREKDIQNFEPETYFELDLDATKKEVDTQLNEIDKRKKDKKSKKKSEDDSSAQTDFVIFKYKDKLTEEEISEVLSIIKNESKIKVVDVNSKESKINPPFPFNLTDFQTEAHRLYRFDPKKTLQIAEKLYLNGYISYPRTSSQKLPKDLNTKSIIQKLSTLSNYKIAADKILSKKYIRPNNGKKDDEAHPAIYPTGNVPKNLDAQEQKLFDLVARRFLACFFDPAIRENQSIMGDIKGIEFKANASKVKEKSWLEVYPVSFKDMVFYDVKKGETLNIANINKYIKETQPPSRYTPASLLKELEKRNLGTKATRADIIDTLFKREYVEGKSITATNLGIKLIETLDQFCPDIIREDLTSHFEDEMEEIRKNKKTKDEVVEEAKGVLTKILDTFKSKEKEIGEKLEGANRTHMAQKSDFGPCPKCGEPFEMKKGPYGYFLVCNSCNLKVSLPKASKISYVKPCPECKYPVAKIVSNGKASQVCVNKECPSKKVEQPSEKRICPKCGSDLVLRKGIYGAFYGCSKFPKCRHVEPVDKSKKSYTKKKKTSGKTKKTTSKKTSKSNSKKISKK